MQLALYGNKNYKGSCVVLGSDRNDLKDTSLKYRTSSAKLVGSTSKALLFSETHWRGDAIFMSGRSEISNLGKDSEGGKDGFGSPRSVRMTPFRIKLKYHFMYVEGDLPGDHSGVGGLLTLAKQIDDMHQTVYDIWSPYLIEFERDPLLSHYNSPKYFEVTTKPNELRQLKDDPNFSFAQDTVHVVLVDIVGAGPRGLGGFAGIGKMHEPVVVLEVYPEKLVFNNGRAIAHEIGHVFGLQHGSNTNQSLLMTQGDELAGRPEDAVRLAGYQVEKVHENLARFASTTDVTANPLLRLV